MPWTQYWTVWHWLGPNSNLSMRIYTPLRSLSISNNKFRYSNNKWLCPRAIMDKSPNILCIFLLPLWVSFLWIIPSHFLWHTLLANIILSIISCLTLPSEYIFVLWIIKSQNSLNANHILYSLSFTFENRLHSFKYCQYIHIQCLQTPLIYSLICSLQTQSEKYSFYSLTHSLTQTQIICRFDWTFSQTQCDTLDSYASFVFVTHVSQKKQLIVLNTYCAHIWVYTFWSRF